MYIYVCVYNAYLYTAVLLTRAISFQERNTLQVTLSDI